MNRRIAEPGQGAWVSLRVINGERPRYIFRDVSNEPSDSGWQFIEGSERQEWLDDPEHCILVHLQHAVERWPELQKVIEDARPHSHWDWDDGVRQYVELP